VKSSRPDSACAAVMNSSSPSHPSAGLMPIDSTVHRPAEEAKKSAVSAQRPVGIETTTFAPRPRSLSISTSPPC
jgi:hypothetical protein